MASISFLTIDQSCNVFSIAPNVEVKVLKYLPIEDKNSLVHLALQDSEENGQYNLIKLDMFFNMYICFMYTDIDFTQEEKDNIAATYDILESMGIIDAVIENMEKKEYEFLHTMLKETLENKLKYRNTIASVINNLVEQLPQNAEEAMNTIKEFNPEKFQEVMGFVRAANGGRDI